MSAEIKAMYSRAWNELINKGNTGIVDELFAPNYVRHDPHFPMSGRDALKDFAISLHNGFSGIRFTIDDMVAEGNKILQRFTLTCTHTGEFMGLPPSVKKLVLTGLTLERVADGWIVEDWGGADWLGWQQQLGIK